MHSKSSPTDLELLELAGRLALAGSAAILEIRSGGFEIGRKADQTPVTAADHASEAAILQGLHDGSPGIPVIAEEEVAAGRIPDGGSSYWLVDPLDGTREFAEGRDEFAVCVGLIRDGRPVLGAVQLPASGELFLGLVGTGAWKQDQAGRRPIRVRTPPPEGLTVYASRHYASDPALARFLEGHKIARLVNAGSALKFCRVAEGEADFYPRLGPTSEWDTAAPQALVEAAGGSVLTFDGEPLEYGKDGFVNPPFLVCGAALMP